MNIHLPAILGFTRYQGFDPSPYIHRSGTVVEELQTLMPGFVSSKTATFCSEQLCNVTDYLEAILVASLDWGRVSGSDIFRPMINETRTT